MEDNGAKNMLTDLVKGFSSATAFLEKTLSENNKNMSPENAMLLKREMDKLGIQDLSKKLNEAQRDLNETLNKL